MTVAVPTMAARQEGGLLPWSVFAALIAMAGLPIYIHAPKFYVDSYGVGLGALGGVLAVLRLIDVVQDPALGWLAERQRARRGMLVAAAAGIMVLAMLALFALPAPIAPLWWFALCLTALFSAFSFLTIAFYAEGVAKAARLGEGGHLRLAGFREGGALIGVCVASVLPLALGGATGQPFAAFAAVFAGVALIATVAMRGQWTGGGQGSVRVGRAAFAAVLRDGVSRRLLLVALVNGAPVAVTSTLFLFFVESRLDAPGAEGPLLLLFFAAAALSAPLWSRVARLWGARRTLMGGMTLAIATFLWAATLGAGDVAAFAMICAASGAALGADMVLLPAIFARRLAAIGQGGEGVAFGLWSFVSKLALALAAATLLPILGAAGFVPGAANDATALATLGALYALLPCALKLGALGLLARIPVTEV